MSSKIRARVTICGTRPLFQKAFGPDAIPLEREERTGVAGNDPEEWRKSMLVTSTGQLYLPPTYIFGCIRDGAKHSKKGTQKLVTATLEVDDAVVLIDRFLPEDGDPPRDPTAPVYIDVRGAINPSTRKRNVRYRLAASPGWQATFTIMWDKTIVAREIMLPILRDAGSLVGIGDGRTIGCGRFQVLSFEVLDDAETQATEGSVGGSPTNRVGKGRQKVRPVRNGTAVDGVPH